MIYKFTNNSIIHLALRWIRYHFRNGGEM